MDWNRFLMSQQNNYLDYENMPQNPQELEKLLAEKIEEGLEPEKEKK